MVSSCITLQKMERLPVLGVSFIYFKNIGNFSFLLKKNLQYLAADLKTGKVYRGEPEKGIKADTTLTIDDSDMIDLVSTQILLLPNYDK